MASAQELVKLYEDLSSFHYCDVMKNVRGFPKEIVCDKRGICSITKREAEDYLLTQMETVELQGLPKDLRKRVQNRTKFTPKVVSKQEENPRRFIGREESDEKIETRRLLFEYSDTIRNMLTSSITKPTQELLQKVKLVEIDKLFERQGWENNSFTREPDIQKICQELSQF